MAKRTMRIICAWRAEDGELYRDRDYALEMSPAGKIEEIWGHEVFRCHDKDHSPECGGPGDIKHHVQPYLRKRKISQLMGQILACCGDDLSGSRSCPCSHVADVLREKLEGPY